MDRGDNIKTFCGPKPQKRFFKAFLERMCEVPDYTALLEQILEICSIPPLLTMSSDVLTFARDLQEYFSLMGYLLVCLKTQCLQSLVSNSLVSLLTRDIPDQRSYLPLRFRKKYAENSRLPEILGQLLEIADENLYTQTLQIILLLVKESDKTCKILIDQNAFNSLLMRLEPTWKERYPDKKPSEHSIDIIPNYEEFSYTMWALLKYLDRNRDYLTNMLSTEFFSICDKSTHVKQMLKDVDHIYLQLLLTLIPYYVKFFGGVTVLENHRIINRLLKLSVDKEIMEWPVAQGCTIGKITLDVLGKVVPYLEDEFIENAGPNSLLNIIRKYHTKNCDLSILRKCLETLYIIIKNSRTDAIINSLLFNNGLNLILGLCYNIILDDDTVRENCLGVAFCLLNTLYTYSEEKNNIIIDMAIIYMKRILNPKSEEAVHDNRTIISMMDFVWEHIVKCEEKSREFVKRNGSFLMLDIIYKFPFPVQLITLGALVDLCEYGQCIPYLITWRRRGQKIIPFLLKMFKEENKRLYVKTGPRGQIADIKYPLMGKEQWIQTFCRCIEVNGNPVMADLFISCRPKIYALLQMLNDRYEEEIEISNECYKSYGDEILEAEDQVTLLLAENFLALKLGEAWIELKTEMDRIPITLIPADNKMVSFLIKRAIKWSSHLQTCQNTVLQNDSEKEMIKEQCLYNLLQESRLSEALQALNELRYIARCSQRMFRFSQKFLQNTQVEYSLMKHDMDIVPHRTYFSKIQVTPVFNQIVDVESKINKSLEETEPKPVSPSISDNECNINLSEDLLESNSELNCSLQE
ncbi:hypothetical protein NQ317_002222 [Molorchus minor]|uniref:Cilia- and flagella-associated protein 69 ARM repeats domain-containing protein n=1 Tax=Molorchus minor TaxID=1323400 RepID=A0ABQ9JPK3_9CUCU|nr:hypothetical protein NQ317_002222 [Molorchus minor]